MSGDKSRFIAVDWGTSSFRAYLMDADGAILAQTESSRGVQTLKAGEHEAVLAEALLNWRRADATAPILMSGMIGSRQGWVEAPYVRAPAGLSETAAAIVTIKSSTLGDIGVVPGVLSEGATLGPDVMRGEETQIFGALAATGLEEGLFVLPGTHSKWARVEKGRIVSFATYMTGEVFAALRHHTILARLMEPGEDAGEGFDAGVQAARSLSTPGDILHAAFMTRTLGLFQRLRPDQLENYLSGLLIGAEIRAGAADGAATPMVIGSAALTKRYREAGKILGLAFEAAPDACVALGQRALHAEWRRRSAN